MICLLLCISYSILFYKQIIKKEAIISFFVGFLSAFTCQLVGYFLIDRLSCIVISPKKLVNWSEFSF